MIVLYKNCTNAGQFEIPHWSEIPSVVYRWEVSKQFGLKKKTALKIIKIYSFLLLTQNFLSIKTRKFQPSKWNSQPKLVQYPHLYTTSVAFKLYTSQTVSITPTQKNPKKSNCSRILILKVH